MGKSGCRGPRAGARPHVPPSSRPTTEGVKRRPACLGGRAPKAQRMSGSTDRSARATSASHAIGKAKTRPGGQQLGGPSKGLLGSPRVERDLVARWPPPPKQLLVSGASRSFGAGEMVVEGAAGAIGIVLRVDLQNSTASP